MRCLAVISLLFILGIHGGDARAQIRIIPKAVLDAVDSPRLSKDSSSLAMSMRHIEAAPMKESDSPVSFMVEMANVGKNTIEFSAIRTSCSCVTAAAGQNSLPPGGKTFLTVRYDPKGHLGRFEHKVFIYTQPGNAPSAVVSLAVQVESGSDRSGLYQVQMGGIRLRTSEIIFRAGEKSVGILNFINLSGKPLELECEEMFLPEYLRFETRPEVVGNGEEGVMVITYEPSGEEPPSVVPVILKDLGVSPRKSTVKIRFE